MHLFELTVDGLLCDGCCVDVDSLPSTSVPPNGTKFAVMKTAIYDDLNEVEAPESPVALLHPSFIQWISHAMSASPMVDGQSHWVSSVATVHR